jgi:hypothetical protein
MECAKPSCSVQSQLRNTGRIRDICPLTDLYFNKPCGFLSVPLGSRGRWLEDPEGVRSKIVLRLNQPLKFTEIYTAAEQPLSQNLSILTAPLSQWSHTGYNPKCNTLKKLKTTYNLKCKMLITTKTINTGGSYIVLHTSYTRGKKISTATFVRRS